MVTVNPKKKTGVGLTNLELSRKRKKKRNEFQNGRTKEEVPGVVTRQSQKKVNLDLEFKEGGGRKQFTTQKKKKESKWNQGRGTHSPKKMRDKKKNNSRQSKKGKEIVSRHRLTVNLKNGRQGGNLTSRKKKVRKTREGIALSRGEAKKKKRGGRKYLDPRGKPA